ncbi:TetR/AcrR family transcriptional regulator [Aeromicrobium sp. A1-2]|uniref:TetR/AcrR family transcriptional regulator n=1 Tax=Aeromicrobium sp. A1-2 TaxID=2107713 RepID=UPI0020B10ACD|nr:TetR/AcrR family transcriptional regulator [Aeromicrobium sp. A1-2]
MSPHPDEVTTEAPQTRTPQGERTRAMRLRLMEATVDCLVELGWAGTTTTVVSKRAGVSRGAQLHHFPSKLDLVVAAVGHLTERRRDDMRQAAADLPEQGRTRAVLEILSAQFVSPVFFAALELWVAARTDAELRESVAPLERRVGRETHAYALELLAVDESRGDNRRIVQATLDLLRGLGLAASLSDDTRRRAAVLDSWAVVLDHELETT